jgi:hypothetical protein
VRRLQEMIGALRSCAQTAALHRDLQAGASIELGIELNSAKASKPWLDECNSSLAVQVERFSELAMLCFLEQIEPAQLPLSQPQAESLRRELEALRSMDNLESYMLCTERLSGEGGFVSVDCGDSRHLGVPLGRTR